MAKKQAHIMIDSKQSTKFDVYFHTKRKTDKMRKEMQSEINLIKKEEHKEKMKDKF